MATAMYAERLKRAVELIGESDSVYVRDLIDVAEDAVALLATPSRALAERLTQARALAEAVLRADARAPLELAGLYECLCPGCLGDLARPVLEAVYAEPEPSEDRGLWHQGYDAGFDAGKVEGKVESSTDDAVARVTEALHDETDFDPIYCEKLARIAVRAAEQLAKEAK